MPSSSAASHLEATILGTARSWYWCAGMSDRGVPSPPSMTTVLAPQTRWIPPEFIHPLPLVAVGLMAVNDHWLKHLFHNSVTGKLSDLAGCFFFPLYVSALLSVLTRWGLRDRLLAGLAVTVAIFAPIKCSNAASAIAAQILTAAGAPLGMGPYRNVADPTDLIALVCAIGAVAWALRRARNDPR